MKARNHSIGKASRSLRMVKKVWMEKKATMPEVQSMRKLAEKLKLSPGYLSKVFSGQKPLVDSVARRLVEVLKPDALSTSLILEPFEPSNSTAAPLERRQDISIFELAPADADWLLGKWYRTVLLDMMTLSNFISDSQWIADQLGITEKDVQTSLGYLEKQGLAYRDPNGIWKKKHRLLRFPTQRSKASIRKHHISQLQRAANLLETKILPKDFHERLFVSLSTGCNLEKLQAVKTELHRQIHEAALELSEGECTCVYQISLQIFPQTKTS